MSTELARALELLEAMEQLEQAALRSPVDHIAWLPPQIGFLSHAERRPALLRLGNRQGKSTAGAAALIYACRGVHPFKKLKKQPPVRCALVCMNMVQSVEIQRVLWELLGAEHNTELVPGTEWTARTGFRGHRPVVEFRNGSSITIYSNAQGAGTLAGAEYDLILLDEPPAQEVYNEALARLRNTTGPAGLLLTLTPINGPPLPWLRKLTEPGENGETPIVADYHYELKPEHCISPLTGLVRKTKDGVPWDQEFIADLEAQVDPITRDIRLHGSWERAYEGQYFKCWDPKKHITRNLPATFDKFYVGFDYASSLRDLGMCAVFVGTKAVDVDGTPQHHIYAIDEVVMNGHDTLDMFAAAVMKMLQTHGVAWTDVDGVYGDNPVKSRWGISSNREMMQKVARSMRMPETALRPRIKSVKEGRGSSGPGRYVYDHRMQWTYQEVATNRIQVHARCETLCKAMLEFDGSARHELKDVSDAFQYAMFDLWQVSKRYGNLPKIMLG